MNENNPIQKLEVSQQMVETSYDKGQGPKYMNSYGGPGHHLDGGEDESAKTMAIMSNKLTQFNTLQMPSYLEESLRKEGAAFAKNMSPEEHKKQMS